MFPIIAAAAIAAGAVPQQIGQCVATRVKQTGSRLDGDPGSGSSISYRNGLYQVSYEVVPGMARSRPGDPVRVCLVSLPTHCPPGDDRGRVYRATNLRTHRTWRAADAEHECGGA